MCTPPPHIRNLLCSSLPFPDSSSFPHKLFPDMASTLPSFESLKSSGRHVRPSIDFIRLRWWLSGPVSTKIKVLASAFDPTSPQSPYKSGEDDAPTFHPIFESPVSHPPVSSIRVTVSCLDNWAESWADEHWDCVFGTPQQGQVTLHTPLPSEISCLLTRQPRK